MSAPSSAPSSVAPAAAPSDALSGLDALSPLDGRYASRVAALRPLLSESAFVRHRVLVEVEWLVALSDLGLPELPRFTEAARARLRTVVEGFSAADAARVKAIEAVTNHDVKAVEYFLKERVAGDAELERASEFIHFACTSEDINNTSHALMLSAACCCRRSSASSRRCARSRTRTPRCRCCRARTASPRRRRRSARRSPTSSRGSRSPATGSPRCARARR
jgi:hypothetical protein